MSSQYKTSTEPALSKSDLRAKMRSARRQLSVDYRRAQSQLIVTRLRVLLDSIAPRTVGMYLATALEVNLDALIEQRHERGEEIYLPHLGDDPMPFHRFISWESLESGPLDLRHPPAQSPALHANRLDVIVLPGLAFDRGGNRLGHGGGWYDKALNFKPSKKKKPVLIGVCFEEQLQQTVPFEPFDVRMDIVVTPSGNWSNEREPRAVL